MSFFVSPEVAADLRKDFPKSLAGADFVLPSFQEGSGSVIIAVFGVVDVQATKIVAIKLNVKKILNEYILLLKFLILNQFSTNLRKSK